MGYGHDLRVHVYSEKLVLSESSEHFIKKLGSLVFHLVEGWVGVWEPENCLWKASHERWEGWDSYRDQIPSFPPLHHPDSKVEEKRIPDGCIWEQREIGKGRACPIFWKNLQWVVSICCLAYPESFCHFRGGMPLWSLNKSHLPFSWSTWLSSCWVKFTGVNLVARPGQVVSSILLVMVIRLK